jgi:putative MATE family efflux protein
MMFANNKKKEINMLEGPIWSQMLLMALPLAATGILQQLFNAADVAVVGSYAGSDAMAAVGSNSPITALVINLGMGLSLGANVLIARFIGRGDKKRVSEMIHTAIPTVIIAGILVIILAEICTVPLLKLLGVPEDVFSMAETYLRIYFAGTPILLLYNLEAAIYRSQGDTRTPLICLAIAGTINVLLNVLMVRVFGMDADGVAIATVISNLVSAVMLMIMLMKRADDLKVTADRISIKPDLLKEMFRIGIPAAVQGMVFSLSNICIQSAINSLGSDVMAASAAAFNIEIVVFYFLNSFSQSGTTFIGQNFGAGNLKRCRRVTRVMLAMSMSSTLVLSMIMVLFGKPILSLFGANAVLIEIGMIRVFCINSPEILNAAIDGLSGIMRGYGSSLIPAIATLLGVCGVRIVWVYAVFYKDPSFFKLMIIYPISWVITLAILAVMYFIVRNKIEKKDLSHQT